MTLTEPPTGLTREPNVTRATIAGTVYLAQRRWHGRWRVVSAPALPDGRPDLAATWTEHGWHDNRTAAEHQLYDLVPAPADLLAA